MEWNDFSVALAEPDRPPTRRLQLGFRASSRDEVDEWWARLTDAGYRDDGQPGARPEYSPTSYGAFVLDPDGNSAEAVHHGDARKDGNVFDHLWVRIRELEASRRFYEAVAPVVGYAVTSHSERLRVHGDGASVSLVEGEPTEGLHLAFSATDPDQVRRFHEAGLRAGFTSLGEPGERPEYHPGYFGAYLADPDGNNVEAVYHDR